MSTERSLEDVWRDQVAMASARGLTIPIRTDPSMHAMLREIMGNDAFELALADEERQAVAAEKEPTHAR